MDVVHQTYVPKSSYSTDIAVSDRILGRPVVMSVHALMEIKWLFQAERFPEAQACIYANYFEKAECCSHRWMPTFVLTKNSFLIGVSFYTKLGRWALAEIDSFAKNAFFEEGEALLLLRFAEFFFEAANFHRSYSDSDYIEGAIVNKTCSVSFQITEICGSRVFRTGNKRVFKFYESMSTACRILKRQKHLEILLGYSSNPELIESCASENDGLCAIVEDFYEEDLEITIHHIQDLVNTVDILSTARFVHGDLRRPNIVFVSGSKARLIDFEWCDQVDIARYPTNVNKAAFLPRACQIVHAGELIPENMDWICLADILDSMGLQLAARYAAKARRDDLIRVLSDPKHLESIN